MFVLLHVLIALAGLVFSGLAALSPSHKRVRASYILVLSTIASGTLLVTTTHSPMLSACLTGLVYTGVCLIGIVTAQRRLVTAETDQERR